MISDNITINEKGHLSFAGFDTVDLAHKYSTPLYLMDEDKIRSNCEIYVSAFKKHFGDNAKILYASKAASFKRIYEIIKEENVGIDVVSSGEIYTALKAGYPLENAYFHGNNKTEKDIAFAIENGIGYFVADNIEELDCINETAAQASIKQKVLLRLTPGIDTHTYEAIATGKVDSKFGVAIETGQADEMVKYALTLKNIDLVGFHCHVGSQVFEEDVFERTADIMLPFFALMKQKYGFITKQFDIGGGYGVRYIESDPKIDIAKNIEKVANHIKAKVAELAIEMPMMLMEPGRSIVADAGMTLYSVGTIKEIPGYKNYVSVDGGMSDNPRFALYGADYTVLLASRANDKADFKCDVVGRCCESGDIIQCDVALPRPKRNEVLAVCTTGAYNYSMASNYNRIPRPPIVMLSNGKDYIAVKRESLEDLLLNDM